MSWIAPARQGGTVDHVVAGQHVEPQPIVGGLGTGDVDPGGEADDRDAPLPSPNDLGDVVAVGALDDDRVGRDVAGGAVERAGEIAVDTGDVGAGQVIDGDRVGVRPGR